MNMTSLLNLRGVSSVLSCPVVPDSLRPYALYTARLLCLWGFSRQEYCSGLPCPPAGDLPNRGTTLQEDSLPSESSGKPKKNGVSSLSLCQGNFLIQESNQLLHCRQILYQLRHQGRPNLCVHIQMVNVWSRDSIEDRWIQG